MPLLDSPVSAALSTLHRSFALEINDQLFYDDRYCPFGATDSSLPSEKALDTYSERCKDFYIVGEKPEWSPRLQLHRQLICLQLIVDQPFNNKASQPLQPLETREEKQELFELVNLVQPGFFRSHTAELGRYFGIRQHGKLIACAGERMRMPGFTELSAIVTHPEHTGKGYASQLIQGISDLLFTENTLPFLHVAESNTSAIRLYEKLGFQTRRKMDFWHFRTI